MCACSGCCMDQAVRSSASFFPLNKYGGGVAFER